MQNWMYSLPLKEQFYFMFRNIRQKVLGKGGSDEVRDVISTGQGRFNFEDFSFTVLVTPELIGFGTEGWKGPTLSSTAQEITKQFGKQVTWLT